MKRLPIKAARDLAEAYGLRQVILAAWDGERTHVVTYGVSIEDCDQAAQGGDMVKRSMNWPEDANCLPSRVKALTAQVASQATLLKAAVHALRSYQFGNGSPDLAKSLADQIEEAS